MIDHLDPPVNVSPDATSDEHENHENHHGEDAVSYTHLTLPTIYSV